MIKRSDRNIIGSSIFCPSIFKPVLKSGNSQKIDKKIKRYFGFEGSVTNRSELLNTIYSDLIKYYRCEYVYKNFITNKILLGVHSINTSNQINEFRIGSSIADTIIINGKATIYEIKSELDSPTRLEEQLDIYSKAFGTICLVVHHSNKNKYLDYVKGTDVGLIVLSSRKTLSTLKAPKSNYESLDIEVMFKCLRKDEYTKIIKNYFGEVPRVPNMFYFKKCLSLARNIDKCKFLTLMTEQLKRRSLSEKELLANNDLPSYLKNICLTLNPNKTGYQYLYKYLNSPI